MLPVGLTLISHHLCPYVQRAAIALSEKGAAFNRRYVDLANKPDWFLSVSPLGKVPLLIVEGGEAPGDVLFESAAICEYIEETQEGPALHSTDPLEKAKHRGWMEFGSSILADLWGFETAKDPASYQAKHAALCEKFARVEEVLGEGPFFSGDRFSLVDAVFAPIFRYFDVFDMIAPTGVLDGLPRLSAWRLALSSRPSVRTAVTEDYPGQIKRFLQSHDAWLLQLALPSAAAPAG